MKKLTFAFGVIFLIFSLTCKKEPSKKVKFEAAQVVGAEIDPQKIQNPTGVLCKILKTETVGYMPIHKFYWVCLKEKTSLQKVEQLADAIISDTIAKKPITFHSFTIHFFCEDEMAETLEKSKSFAQATFLPEGNWQKVGRVPLMIIKATN
jgi:hypothetical protein